MSGVDPAAAGLCARCRHARVIATPRSRFLFCEKSRVDSSYERYPRLPVLACPGYELAGGGGGDGDERPAEGRT